MPQVLAERSFVASSGVEHRTRFSRDDTLPHDRVFCLQKRSFSMAVALQFPDACNPFGSISATPIQLLAHRGVAGACEATPFQQSQFLGDVSPAAVAAHRHGGDEVGRPHVMLLPTPARSQAGIPGGSPVPADAQTLRLRDLVAAIAEPSAEPGAALRVVAELRRELAACSAPPINEVIALGGAAALVDCLGDGSAALQLEATWALTNLTAGTSAQTASVLGAGVAEAVVMVLNSDGIASSAELCKQCLWVLRNVAGDQDVACRDHLLQICIFDGLGELFGKMPEFGWSENECKEVLEMLTTLMSSLCQGQPAPDLKEVDCTIDYFAQVLQGTDDAQMMTDAFVGLASLLEGSPDEACLEGCCRQILSAFAEIGVAPLVCHPAMERAVHCLRFGGPSSLSSAALSFVGALLVAPGPECTTLAIAAGILPVLKTVLCDVRMSDEFRLRASWALANVVAAGPSAAEHVVDEPGLLPALCEALERSPVPEVRRECAWAFAGVLCSGPSVLGRLELRKTLRRITTSLRVAGGLAGRSDLLSTLLDGAEALLTHGGHQPRGGIRLRATAEECGFFAEVEALRRADDSIGRRASELLDHPRLACAAAENENVEPSAENVPPQQFQKTSSRKFGDIVH